MPEIVITAARYGFLLLLWVFVFTVVGVIRRDLGARPSRLVAAPRGVVVATGGRPAKVKRGKAAAYLAVTRGDMEGARLTLGTNQVTIGRADDSDLVISDEFASARHARIVPRDGQWYVEDLGSTNGTYLDEAKVVAPTLVHLGVPIRIGRTVIELRP